MSIPQIFVGIFNNKVSLVNKTRFLPFLLLVASLFWGNFSTVNAQNITQFEPTSGTEGTEVRIYGSGFDATASNNTVTFGETEATVTGGSSNVLYATIPQGESGPVEVSVSNSQGSASSANLYTIVTGGNLLEEQNISIAELAESSIDVGDFDNDGDMDIVVVGGSGLSYDLSPVIRLYENDGNGNFSTVETEMDGIYKGEVSFGDYDGDGDLDIIINGADEGTFADPLLYIYRNDGNGEFTQLDLDINGLESGSVDWADFDGDGDLDFVMTGRVSSTDHTTKLYENVGNDEFSEVDVALHATQEGVARWGDYNNDGVPDLVIAGNDEFIIYRNNGDANFEHINAGLPSMAYSKPAWIDYDNDGDLDLFVIGEDSDATASTMLFENQGDGEFVEVEASFLATIRDDFSWGDQFDWGDYNSDGYPDLVIISEEENALFKNNGDGTFTKETEAVAGADFLSSINSSSFPAGSPAWIDIDGDGDLDLIATGTEGAVSYENVEQPSVPSPENFSLEVDAFSQELTWDASEDEAVSSYVIYHGEHVSEMSELTTVSADVTTYDIDEEVGIYAIKAETESGNRSPFAGPVSYIYHRLNMTDSWDLVSTGLKDDHVNLYDENIGYSFSGTYEFVEELYSGDEGYWVKSREDDYSIVSGEGLVEASISFGMTSRWHLVGSLSDTAIVSDPNNVLGNSTIYRYDGETKNYQAVERIHPGEGHWIYINNSQDFFFSLPDLNEEASKQPERPFAEGKGLDEIIFSNPEVNQSLLYATKPLPKEEETAYRLPPKPPEPYLDVRTKDGLRAGEGSSTALDITTDTYPIQVSLDKGKEDGMAYQVVLQDGGNEITYPLTEEKSQTIDREYDQIYLKQMPADEVVIENELSPNYPNPFNPTTAIRYQVSSQSNVTMNVYNVLGQKVRSLVNETKQPGSYEVRFDGSNLASGVYYVRIQIGEFTDLQKMTLIK